jgi:hypothetical protein
MVDNEIIAGQQKNVGRQNAKEKLNDRKVPIAILQVFIRPWHIYGWLTWKNKLYLVVYTCIQVIRERNVFKFYVSAIL